MNSLFCMPPPLTWGRLNLYPLRKKSREDSILAQGEPQRWEGKILGRRERRGDSNEKIPICKGFLYEKKSFL